LDIQKTKVIIIGYPKTRSKSSKNTILGLFWTKNGIIVGYPLIQEVTPLLLREKKIKYIKTFATPYRLDNIGYPKTKWRNFMRNSISEVEFICIFADNLSDIMDEVGISQRQLAKKAHITEAALSRYLNKQRMPNMRTFMNLCYALQCEYSDLLPTYSMVE
jgi:DNA-binding Xre family transcriptional regulator